MTEHVHGCYACDPGRFPTHDARLSESHVAAWFEGDRSVTDVFLDGVKVPRCVEAFADRHGHGWAVVTSEPTHQCFCAGYLSADSDRSGGACMTKVTGAVSIVRAVPA